MEKNGIMKYTQFIQRRQESRNKEKQTDRQMENIDQV